MKRLLTEERIPGASAIARFVGVDAYEAAGGIVLRDLFAHDDETGVWFEEPALLEKLATGKLQAAADELATRWKWATAMIEVDWNDTARHGRIEPQRADPSDEERAEIDRLQTRHDELVNLDDGDWTEELVAEGDASRPGSTRSRPPSRRGRCSAARTSRWRAASSPSAGTARCRSSRGW